MMNGASDTGSLRPQLGLGDATLLVIGAILGAGIFTTPGFVADMLRSEAAILLAWVVGGVIALAGALSYAELGAAWPRAGGHYVYMRMAYGPFWGFLDGWASALINFPGSIAALALAAAAYLGELMPVLDAGRIVAHLPLGVEVTMGQSVAAAVIVILSAVNDFGVRPGVWVQNVTAVLKVAIFAVFIVVGLLWSVPEAAAEPMASAPGPIRLSALGAALIAVMFTYFGWDSATYVASEIRRPSRNLPLAALWGTLTVAALYIALNIVFLRVVPPDQMGRSVVVADTAARTLFGPIASRAVTAAIVLCILGGLNATILTGPRVLYAMSRDGLFFRGAAKVHPHRHTPRHAIWMQAGLSVLLALTGTFEALFTAAGFVITLLAGATAVAVLVMRRRRPDHPRPYRAIGAPLTPLLFAAAALWIAVSSIVERPVYSLGGLAVLLTAWPVYRAWAARGGGPVEESRST